MNSLSKSRKCSLRERERAAFTYFGPQATKTAHTLFVGTESSFDEPNLVDEGTLKAPLWPLKIDLNSS